MASETVGCPGKTNGDITTVHLFVRRVTAAPELKALRLPPGNILEFLKVIGKVNTVSASTTNGAYASGGKPGMHMTLKRKYIGLNQMQPK